MGLSVSSASPAVAGCSFWTQWRLFTVLGCTRLRLLGVRLLFGEKGWHGEIVLGFRV